MRRTNRSIYQAHIFAAKSRLRYIKQRLDELDTKALSEALSADLLAEQSLLRTLSSNDEQLLVPDSAVQRQIQKTSNSNAMFDATLRAVSERRSERLDELGIDSIRAGAHSKRAEMDKILAETRESVLQAALDSQAKFASELVGLLARCTVMMGEGGAALKDALSETLPESDADNIVIARNIAESMDRVAKSNDKAFVSMIGASTASFQSARDSTLLKFTPHSPANTSTSRPVPRSSAGSRAKPPIRSSFVGGRRRSSITLGAPSPRRLNTKSPRRPGGRQSLVRGPPARAVEKKSVRWRDQTSLCEIDGKDLRSKAKKSIRWHDQTSSDESDNKDPRPARRSVSQPVKTIAPLVLVTKPDGRSRDESDAEWEDERTEDSMSTTSSASTVTAKEQAAGRGIRDRLVRSSKPPPMTSVGEETEGEESPARPKRSPLGDVVNSPPLNHSEESPSSKRSDKTRARPVTPPNVSPMRPSRATSVPGSVSKSSRRLSNIGPLRAERKSRRRSSLIPRPSPPSAGYTYAYAQPRKTPSKKRRASAVPQPGGGPPMLWVKPARPAFSHSLGADSSSILEKSVLIGKPTWR